MSSAAAPASPGTDRVGDLLRRRLLPAVALTAAAPWLRGAAPAPAALLAGGLALIWLGLLLGWAGRRAGLPPERLLVLQVGADCTGLAALMVAGSASVGLLPLAYTLPILVAAYCLGPRAAQRTTLAAAALVVALGLAGASGLVPGQGAAGELLAGSVLAAVLLLTVGGIAHDLAERAASGWRLQAQAAGQMQRARTEIRNVLDQISSGLLLLDERGVIVRANPAAAEILGLAADGMVGQPLAAVLGPAGEEFTACVMAVVEGGPPASRRELRIRREGREVPLGVSVSHQLDREERRVGAIAIFKDLSEICRLRDRMREADRLAAVGELAASIAHEIRNPLSSLRGSVELLSSELELSGQQERLLELIQRESARVNKIIDDFLAFARLRPSEPRLVACDELMAEVALQVRQHVGAHGGGVELTHRVQPHDLQIVADPEQMTQLFLNLAINACEAMEYRGRLLVAVETATPGRGCLLKVCDSGPGIDPAAREHLFKPFFTTKKGGTGLGLAMVSRIAHAHGGSVELIDSPLGGAGLCVRLQASGAGPTGDPNPGRPGSCACADAAPAPAGEPSLV